MTKLNETIQTMLKENTGSNFLDSGGAYGRHWERNQTIDFETTEPITWELSTWPDGDVELIPTISTYHYLKEALDLDDICLIFNLLQDQDNDFWIDSEFYGMTAKGWDYLENDIFTYHDYKIESTFNTYNGESSLSQILQGTYITIDNSDYVLLQIHNGCDARGGYTTSKLFCLEDECLPSEHFSGEIDEVSIFGYGDCSSYIENENGERVEIKADSKVNLTL